MARQRSMVQVRGILTMAVLMASCANATTETTPTFGFSSVPEGLLITADVRRMAVLNPRGGNPEWSSAYSRLEGAAFQLGIYRPNPRIIDRSHLPALISEQRFQGGGIVSEESAVRIGRILGVDSVLIYRIDGHTLRESKVEKSSIITS